MNTLQKITLSSSLIAFTTLACFYSYSFFGMYNAYAKKNYDQVFHHMHNLKYFSTHYDLAITTAIEQTMEEQLQESHLHIVDPTLTHSIYDLRSIIPVQYLREHNSPLTMFAHMIHEENVNGYYLSLLNKKKPFIYTNFLASSTNLHFRNKEVYTNSCYTYPLSVHIHSLHAHINQHYTPHKNRQTSFTRMQHRINPLVNALQLQVETLHATQEKSITHLYYQEVEKLFYKSIQKIHTTYTNESDKTKQAYFAQLIHRLYSSLELHSSTRNNYPRSSYEQSDYIELQQLVNSLHKH